MVKKSDLMYTYDEVRGEVRRLVEEKFNEIKSAPLNKRKANIIVWVKNLNVDLINDIHLKRLKKEFVEYGWESVIVSISDDNYTKVLTVSLS